MPAAASATRTMRSFSFCQPDFSSTKAPLARPWAALEATAGLALVIAVMVFELAYPVASDRMTPFGRETAMSRLLAMNEKCPQLRAVGFAQRGRTTKMDKVAGYGSTIWLSNSSVTVTPARSVALPTERERLEARATKKCAPTRGSVMR